MVCLLLVTLPLAAEAMRADGFLPNEGQVDEAARFYTSAAGGAVWFTSDAIVLDLKEKLSVVRPSDRREAMPGLPVENLRRGHTVRIHLDGARPDATIEGLFELPGRTSYFRGSDPARWTTGIVAYAEIVYREAWPGVDLAFRVDHGALEYELRAAPEADLSRAGFRYEGADRVIEAGDGVRRLETSLGTVTDRRPNPGVLSGRISLDDDSRPATTDLPGTLEWATHVGTSGTEYFNGCGVDASDRPVAGGLTDSPDFPTTVGAYQETYAGGAIDAVVLKLSADGSSLVWSTYLGGGPVGSIGGNDVAHAVAVDPGSEAVYVWGGTNSLDFPTTPGCFDSTRAASATERFDNFVTKLSADGESLLWSTYLGGAQAEYNLGNIALDATGNLVVAGITESGNFPTTPGAVQEDFPGIPGVFETSYVTKFDGATGFPIWSTFLGGTNRDLVWGLSIDTDGGCLIGLSTFSTDFPTTAGAFDETYNGGWDAALCKISADGSSLEWSSFLGGSDNDYGGDCLRHPSGNLVFVAESVASSTGFPITPGVFDETHNGGDDLVAASFDADCTNLQWSTYFGGDGLDYASAAFIDADGVLVLGFQTTSTDLPIPWADALGPYDSSYNGALDMGFARLTPDGRTLLWSTYLGGSGDEGLDEVDHVELAGDGRTLLVSSWTASSDFPATPGSYDETYNGGLYDGAVLRILPPDATAAPLPAAAGLSMLRSINPNPARGGSIVHYELPRPGTVALAVYDPAGRLVRILEEASREAGSHRVTWDGHDGKGRPVAAGVYFVQLRTGSAREARSLTVLR
jgi:hypothetical protein